MHSYLLNKIVTIYRLVFPRDCISACFNALFMSAYDITNLLNAMFRPKAWRRLEGNLRNGFLEGAHVD